MDSETRQYMANNAKEIFAKALDFAEKPDRLKRALDLAQEAKIRFIQLGDEYLEKQGQVAAVIEDLEQKIAKAKMATFEVALEDVRDAARRWGTCPEDEISTEKFGRLQTGLWLAFQEREDLRIWNKEGVLARRPLDPNMALVVGEYTKKLQQNQDVKKVELTEVYKVMGDVAIRWVMKLSITATWGKRSYLIEF